MKKGMTVASISIMIVIIFILLGTITIISYNSIENAKKTVLALEISNIQEEVDNYIKDSSSSEYPILNNLYEISLAEVSTKCIDQFDGEIKTSENTIELYEVDLSLLGINDTMYGNKKDNKDVYVLSKLTGKVYYLNGVKSKGYTYYTLTQDLLDLSERKETKSATSESVAPVITVDGFVTNTLSNGNKEMYLTNIKVDQDVKKFKYETAFIPREKAKEYFANNGKTVMDDRIKFSTKTDVTLYAENENGDYDVLNCFGLSLNGQIYPGLYQNSKDAIDEGIEIGDVVTGYTLDSSKTSYSTSGKENTAPENSELSEGIANNVSQIEYETWRYIGIGEKGEILIAPDMVSSVTTSQKIILSGKGGYLYGPAELDNVCKELYSTSKGIARSMNIEDINRLLNYAGAKGSYYDASEEPILTPEAKKISKIGTLSYTRTPDGTDIGNYYSNYYSIEKINVDDSVSDDLKNFVYTNVYYWLSSSCVVANLSQSRAIFYIYYVTSSTVDGRRVFYSNPYSRYDSYAIRPVVALDSTVTLSKDDEGKWTI